MLLALLSQCKSNLCGMPIKQQVYHTCTRCRLLSYFLNKVFFVRFKSISIPFGEHVCMFFSVQHRRVHVLSVLSIYAEGWSWKFPWIFVFIKLHYAVRWWALWSSMYGFKDTGWWIRLFDFESLRRKDILWWQHNT